MHYNLQQSSQQILNQHGKGEKLTIDDVYSTRTLRF
jgi:hypothetical protein